MILSELLWQINSTTGSSLWTYFFILFQLHFTTRDKKTKKILSIFTNGAIIDNRGNFPRIIKKRMIGVKVKLLVQIGIVFVICLLGELIAKLLPFVFPSSVISMILLFLLLLS